MRKNKLSVDDCLSYMKGKYGCEFTLLDDDKESKVQLTAQYLEIFVESPEQQGEKILVVEELKDGSVLYHDNYVAIKYRQETKKLAEKLANEIFDECRVLYEPDNTRYQPDEFNDTTTFEEFISKKQSKIYISVLLPPEHSDENKEQELKEMEQKCIEHKLVCICDIYYASDEEAYQSVNSDADVMNAGHWYKADGQFVIDDELSVSSEMWR